MAPGWRGSYKIIKVEPTRAKGDEGGGERGRGREEREERKGKRLGYKLLR